MIDVQSFFKQENEIFDNSLNFSGKTYNIKKITAQQELAVSNVINKFYNNMSEEDLNKTLKNLNTTIFQIIEQNTRLFDPVSKKIIPIENFSDLSLKVIKLLTLHQRLISYSKPNIILTVPCSNNNNEEEDSCNVEQEMEFVIKDFIENVKDNPELYQMEFSEPNLSIQPNTIKWFFRPLPHKVFEEINESDELSDKFIFILISITEKILMGDSVLTKKDITKQTVSKLLDLMSLDNYKLLDARVGEIVNDDIDLSIDKPCTREGCTGRLELNLNGSLESFFL